MDPCRSVVSVVSLGAGVRLFFYSTRWVLLGADAGSGVCLSVGSSDFVCELIDYFPREHYAPDDTDSTMAIPSKTELPPTRSMICIPASPQSP